MKTLIAIPAMSWVYTDFMQSMLALDKPDAQLMIQQNSLTHDARNNLAWTAMQNKFDRVLWLDSDMQFEPDLLTRLSTDMDEHGLDLVAGWYTERRPNPRPCIYRSVIWEHHDGQVTAKADPVEARPAGLAEIAGCGFGAVLMTTELIESVCKAYGAPFHPLPFLGEDLSFCWRAAQLGRRMYCDGAVRVGHIGTRVYKEDTP